jgi:hypothetical protein
MSLANFPGPESDIGRQKEPGMGNFCRLTWRRVRLFDRDRTSFSGCNACLLTWQFPVHHLVHHPLRCRSCFGGNGRWHWAIFPRESAFFGILRGPETVQILSARPQFLSFYESRVTCQPGLGAGWWLIQLSSSWTIGHASIRALGHMMSMGPEGVQSQKGLRRTSSNRDSPQATTGFDRVAWQVS